MNIHREDKKQDKHSFLVVYSDNQIQINLTPLFSNKYGYQREIYVKLIVMPGGIKSQRPFQARGMT